MDEAGNTLEEQFHLILELMSKDEYNEQQLVKLVAIGWTLNEEQLKKLDAVTAMLLPYPY